MNSSSPTKQRHRAAVWCGGILLFTFMLLGFLVNRMRSQTAAAAPLANEFGYGFNVADWDIPLLQSMGFNWVKVFNGPGSRLPVNVLLRVEAKASNLADINGFGDNIQGLAQSQKGFVDAYEIGNEPNLDASYGWDASPNASDYVNLLCEAYSRIKAVDPDAVVVSAGLAPTGRVQGSWNGHAGHLGGYQDEREYFKEFIAAGGGSCLDAVGYHPYGFSADFDAEPDVQLNGDTLNCVNGFCFRGAEKLYQLMADNGLGDKRMWATEFGWIVRPPDVCLSDGSWNGRLWQMVSEEKQASNLVGAYQYARANWPWMEAMFIFNLNFNSSGWYNSCEQMTYYGVEGRPAEEALRQMSKADPAPPVARLSISPGTIGALITQDQQPYSKNTVIHLNNIGTLTTSYTMTVQSAALTPILTNSSGLLAPGESAQAQVTIESSGRPTGTFTATIQIAANAGTEGVPFSIPVNLTIADQLYYHFLPVVQRQP